MESVDTETGPNRLGFGLSGFAIWTTGGMRAVEHKTTNARAAQAAGDVD
jgi:hypothetical protein